MNIEMWPIKRVKPFERKPRLNEVQPSLPAFASSAGAMSKSSEHRSMPAEDAGLPTSLGWLDPLD